MFDSLINLAAKVLAVFFVFVPHEFAHAYVAYKNGDPTPKMYGRLTVDPFKHIDPIGLALCAVTGFGWAKPVPINPYNFKKYKVGLFTTAIAGVVTNYIFAFISYPLYLLISLFAMPHVVVGTIPYIVLLALQQFFYILFLYSLSVFVFNLIPLNPLDGFRVVESLTEEINPVRRFLTNYGQYILIGLVLESILCGNLIRFRSLEIFKYFDILGNIQWFAEKIIGFPIIALWNAIFGLSINIFI